MSTVFAFHTAALMIEQVKSLFDQYLPEVILYNMLDDSILPEILKEERVTGNVAKRIKKYFQSATDAGADLIFNTCSSVGDVIPMVQPEVSVPIIQIDHAMAEKVVYEADNIGILATLPSTLDPTKKLLLKTASKNKKKIHLVSGLAEGAFDALKAGNRLMHDKMIMNTAEKISVQCDIFVLAQGSMAHLEEQLQKLTQKKVFSSTRLGVLAVKSTLELINS